LAPDTSEGIQPIATGRWFELRFSISSRQGDHPKPFDLIAQADCVGAPDLCRPEVLPRQNPTQFV
jgi:hypothetical protein